ncbi:esterase ovca2 [Holotrichia oblita]|uniref:Esterase ovca2 n=1 Tax=Holotrichia oblita TaxID=644536 RepID=A0ACB9SY15_HOLOL|nr:esterase ovca2 [Holotrichia oblita]
MVHKWAEFTFITAPHKVLYVSDLQTDKLDVQQSPDAEQYGWFFNRDDHTFRGIRKGGPAIGFEESIAVVEEAFNTYGPFDGILGFSQGGCFTGLLCDLQNRNCIALLNFSFNFVMIISGFKSASLPHIKYYEDLISLPSLHVFGQNDDIIPTGKRRFKFNTCTKEGFILDMSAALRDCFNDPVTVTHGGGHYFPATAVQKEDYQKFFKTRYDWK